MTQEQLDFTNGLTLAIGRGMTREGVVELITTRDLTRDLAAEAAALERAHAAFQDEYVRHDSMAIGMIRGLKAIRSLITPPHVTALEAHDRELTAKLVAASCSNPNVVKEVLREREDRMLKRFEELAGTLKWINGGAHFSHELLSTIASIRKDRE